MKRRRTIAKTSKQTIQPSLAEEEKRRGGIRRKREMKEEENERKRREGEKEINARKIGAGGRRGRSGREKHARREGLYAYYQPLPGRTWGLAGAAAYYWYWRCHGRRKWRDLTVLMPEVLRVLRDRPLPPCDYTA